MLNTLNLLKITNHFLITGFKKEMLDSVDTNKIYNSNFKNSSQMDSINLALDYNDPSSLIIFSDIIFEKHLIERLIASKEDITFLISPIEKNYNNNYSDKIAAKYVSKKDGRFLTTYKFNEVLKIGKNLSEDVANFEYAGICYLSNKGIKILKDAYKDSRKNNLKTDFISVFNYIIKKKLSKIFAIETLGGWIEIRDKESYLLAKKIL